MKWLVEAWLNLSSINICNCWSYCFKDNSNDDSPVTAVERILETTVTSATKDRNVRYTRDGIQSLLISEEENFVLEVLFVDHLVKQIVSNFDSFTGGTSNDFSWREGWCTAVFANEAAKGIGHISTRSWKKECTQLQYYAFIGVLSACAVVGEGFEHCLRWHSVFF